MNKMEKTIRVNNSRLIHLKQIKDPPDGTISVAQHGDHIPFEIKRVYYIYDLNNTRAVRGKHAHKQLEQVLFCVSGSCSVGLDDGVQKQTLFLDDPNTGVYLGVGLWHTMECFSDDCILLVLASGAYDENDYIRDYEDFKQFLAQR